MLSKVPEVPSETPSEVSNKASSEIPTEVPEVLSEVLEVPSEVNPKITSEASSEVTSKAPSRQPFGAPRLIDESYSRKTPICGKRDMVEYVEIIRQLKLDQKEFNTKCVDMLTAKVNYYGIHYTIFPYSRFPLL